MITNARKFTFDSGHRIPNHESKCRNLHGHTYTLIVHVKGKRGSGHELDELGRVIDFSVLKEKLGGWLDEYWDHGMILFREDPWRHAIIALNPDDPLLGTKVFLLPFIPTAENLAYYVLSEVAPKLFKDDPIDVVKVELWETPNCYAVAKYRHA